MLAPDLQTLFICIVPSIQIEAQSALHKIEYNTRKKTKNLLTKTYRTIKTPLSPNSSRHPPRSPNITLMSKQKCRNCSSKDTFLPAYESIIWALYW